MGSRIKIILLSALITLSFFYIDQKIGITGNFYTVERLVVEVIDGDTIKIETGEKVRLVGINSPEIGEYLYEESKKFLEREIKGKRVRLFWDDKKEDIYGRRLAFVFLGNENINVKIVRNGLAHTYEVNKIKKYSNELIEAERYARENGLGIWKKSEKSVCIELVNLVYTGIEKIVLKNVCPFVINLEGWSIEDEAHHKFVFPKYNLRPNETIEIYTTENAFFSFRKKYPILNKDGDSIFLRDSKGYLVLFYRY